MRQQLVIEIEKLREKLAASRNLREIPNFDELMAKWLALNPEWFSELSAIMSVAPGPSEASDDPSKP